MNKYFLLLIFIVASNDLLLAQMPERFDSLDRERVKRLVTSHVTGYANSYRNIETKQGNHSISKSRDSTEVLYYKDSVVLRHYGFNDSGKIYFMGWDTYSRNGRILYTTALSPYGLMFDSAVYTAGGKISQVYSRKYIFDRSSDSRATKLSYLATRDSLGRIVGEEKREVNPGFTIPERSVFTYGGWYDEISQRTYRYPVSMMASSDTMILHSRQIERFYPELHEKKEWLYKGSDSLPQILRKKRFDPKGVLLWQIIEMVVDEHTLFRDTIRYTYDKKGKLLSSIGHPLRGNEVLPVEWEDFSYTAAGLPVRRRKFEGALCTAEVGYTYDKFGNVTWKQIIYRHKDRTQESDTSTQYYYKK